MVHGNFHMENFTFFPQNVPTLGHLFPKKIFCKKSLDSSQPLFLLLPGGENSQQKKKEKKPCLETQVCVFFTIQNYM